MDDLLRQFSGDIAFVLSVYTIADLLIGFPMMVIAATLMVLLFRARGRLVFGWVPFAFALFIGACGLGYLLRVLMLTSPDAASAFAIVQVLTVAASIAMAISLPRLVPVIRRLVAADQNETARAEELRESEERYRAVVEQSIDGIVIVQDTTIVYANRAYAALMGLADPASVVGRAFDSFVAPEQRADMVVRALARQRGEDVPDRYVVKIRPMDGTTRLAEVSATIISHGGRPASLGVVRDVTERVRIAAEREELLVSERSSRLAAAREAAEKEAILQQMTDAVLVVGADYRVSIANPAAAAFFGLEQTALVGMPVTAARGLNDGTSPWSVFDESNRLTPAEDRPLARALRGETATEDSHTILADGRERWSSAMASPLRDSDGVIAGAVLVLRDTTAQHAAKERAGQSEKLRLLGQMAGGIAHDLNQSLAMVTGFTGLIRSALTEHVPNLVEARAMLGTVAQAAMDGGSAVQRLLIFTRDRDDGPPERVNLGEMLHHVSQLTAPRWRDAAQAEGRPIALTVVADPDVVALGHPALLRQALTNLVINAADALPGGGEIKLTTRSMGDTVEIAVADTGVGMTVEVQRRAFEPFYSTKGDRGTGLGLAQVVAIAEKHGGRVDLRSTPGQGTTVMLHLPAAPSEAGDTETPVATNQPDSTRRACVLVVDDEPQLARMAALVLQSGGHTATTATSGEEALERLSAESFDLVVSDLSMGAGMNGWDLAEEVRQRWPNTRVVLATGWGASIDQAQARSRGVSGVLAKPYDTTSLLRMVDAAQTPCED